MKEIDQKLATELEERDRELNARVMQATFEQVEAKLAADIEILKKAVPTAEKEARETALDVKYVKDRQRILETDFQRLFVRSKQFCLVSRSYVSVWFLQAH